MAIRLNDDIVFLEPNLAVIGEVDMDDENVIASEGLIATAKAAGTFVGDEEENIIDFRASYANLGTEASPRVGAPRPLPQPSGAVSEQAHRDLRRRRLRKDDSFEIPVSL